jgi:hypothetical protein
LPAECDINFPDAVVSADIASLHNDEQVSEELRFQLSEVESLIGSVRNGIAMSKSALRQLEERTGLRSALTS